MPHWLQKVKRGMTLGVLESVGGWKENIPHQNKVNQMAVSWPSAILSPGSGKKKQTKQFWKAKSLKPTLPTWLTALPFLLSREGQGACPSSLEFAVRKYYIFL